jgi:hypothetical protein
VRARPRGVPSAIKLAFTRGGQRHDVDAIQAVLALQNVRYVNQWQKGAGNKQVFGPAQVYLM